MDHPSGDPANANALLHEGSPYLRQHAWNPVDWRPWGEAAFEEARRLDRPVFLSIGYSTCHWCHVMNRESFSNPAIAQLMNEAFVNIKLDREERPDIDHVYMEVTVALTGQGGWPMTVIMTPDKKPFFAGTYFPPRSVPGRIGMDELAPLIRDAWHDKRGELLESADAIAREVAKRQAPEPASTADPKVLDAAVEVFSDQHDDADGGFGGGRMKFPMPHQHLFLMRRLSRGGDPRIREMLGISLARMREGGLFDQIGGGFHRYATDRVWLLPHFEKMLYDNALLAMAYTRHWQLEADPESRRIALETLEYMRRDLSAPDGGFYSAEDADAEGEEGKFHVWRVEEVEALLSPAQAAIACAHWNLSGDGNFHDESTGVKTGANIPHIRRPLAESAKSVGQGVEEAAANLGEARRILFEAREKRVRPHRDEKVLADWNGLAIAAFAKAARAFGDAALLARAQAAAGFLLGTLRGPDGRLRKRAFEGQAGVPPTLEDYAFAAWGLLELYQAAFDPRHLEAAVEFAEILLREFQDDANGGFFLTAHDAEPLIFRSRDVHDGAIPSGNSVAAFVLARLASMTQRGDLAEACDRTLDAFFRHAASNPLAHAFYLCALDERQGPATQIVLAGERDTEAFEAMAEVLRPLDDPGVVLLHRPPGDAPEALGLAPWLASYPAPADGAAAFVCRDHACQAPAWTPGELCERLAALA